MFSRMHFSIKFTNFNICLNVLFNIRERKFNVYFFYLSIKICIFYIEIKQILNILLNSLNQEFDVLFPRIYVLKHSFCELDLLHFFLTMNERAEQENFFIWIDFAISILKLSKILNIL